MVTPTNRKSEKTIPIKHTTKSSVIKPSPKSISRKQLSQKKQGSRKSRGRSAKSTKSISRKARTKSISRKARTKSISRKARTKSISRKARAKSISRKVSGDRKKKTIKVSRKTINDVYGLRGKQVCRGMDSKSGNEDYLFGDVYAFSHFFIYKICPIKKPDDCDKKLAKVYSEGEWKWWNESPREKIDQEAEYMRRASELGVSPAYIGYNWCEYDGNEYAIILMEKWGDGNLTELYPTNEYNDNKTQINQTIKEKLDILYGADINHGDMHSDNFLYQYNKETNKYEFMIIDFDQSEPLGKSTKKYKIEILIPRKKSKTLDLLK